MFTIVNIPMYGGKSHKVFSRFFAVNATSYFINQNKQGQAVAENAEIKNRALVTLTPIK